MSEAETPTGSGEPDPMVGKVFEERYRIEAPLGEGGIGRVYKARHLTLGRMVALKVLLTKYESIGVLQERFKREAEALAALSHPNIVTVTDFGVADGNYFIVMELLEGQDLATLIEHGDPLEPKRAFEIIRQMLRALSYAHAQGLVHRDLKPHNVFVRPLGDSTDHVHVLDFGLARFMGDAAKSAPKLTRQGALIGTPAYMAPEQASGEQVDARADVYAAGCVLFEALTGRRVFESNDPGEVLRAHLIAAPPKLGQADTGLEVAPELEALVARALEKSPSARYGGAKELLEALDALGPSAAKRVGPRPPRDKPISGVAPTQAAGDGSGAAATRAATPSAKIQNASASAGSAIVIPTSKLPMLVGAGFAVAVLLLGVGAGVWFLTGALGADDDTPTVEPPVVEPPDQTPVEPEVPAPPPRPDARNPFEGELPEPLANVHTRVTHTRRMSEVNFRRHLSTISQYQREHPDDPLPHLLLGHMYTDKRWLSRALPEYRHAHELDASVRGDPDMIVDLLEMVRSDSLEREAADFVVEAYGAEALGPIETALEERGLRRTERDHLEALRARISPAPADAP